jgi:hypothetical protein
MREHADKGLSDVLRRQLRDLRIDVNETPKSRPCLASRLRTWSGEHKEPIAVIGCVVGVMLLITGLVVVMAYSVSGASTSALGGGPQLASISLGDVNVQVVPPAYRRLSANEVMLFVRLDLRNTLGTPAELIAGDLLLADRRGALFPPSWQDTSGTSVDGLAQPDHTLLAVAPGAEVQIDVQFLVLSDGPFSLRYEPRPQHAQAAVPDIGLLPNPTTSRVQVATD